MQKGVSEGATTCHNFEHPKASNNERVNVFQGGRKLAVRVAEPRRAAGLASDAA